MQPQPNNQSRSSTPRSKRFLPEALVFFFVLAGVIGFFYFLVYRPLLTWSPTTPPVYVSLSDTVYFDVNSTEIQSEAWVVLENIAKHNAGRIVVAGGADSTGDMLKNWKLAQARANSVREMLIGLKVRPDSIMAITFGDRRPIVSKQIQFNRYTIIQWKKRQ
jgi:outer membrane protein OmpA-like peptidoglycan-associated protein